MFPPPVPQPKIGPQRTTRTAQKLKLLPEEVASAQVPDCAVVAMIKKDNTKKPQNFVRELKSRGATVLLATHQWPRAAALTDRALVLEAGRVTWLGSASEVMNHEVRS